MIMFDVGRLLEVFNYLISLVSSVDFLICIVWRLNFDSESVLYFMF